MGDVYLSYSRDGLPVAIKLVKRELAEDLEFRRRFTREVAAAQRVQGQFTAPVIAADPDGPVPWLATAYVAGPSLARAVAEHGPFPVPAVLRLLAGAAQGIAAVHAAGLIHRDLKPANVLLAADGPRVIDFGIAYAADSSTLTSTGQAIGTPAFMAPEQIRGGVTEATDVWALGQLALWAATGHAAFGDGNQSAIIHRILNEPPDLSDCDLALRPIIERCLAKDPGDRPSVGQVLAAASDALHGQTATIAVGSWLPRPVAAALGDYAAPPPPAPGTSLTPPPGQLPGSSSGRFPGPPSGPYPPTAGPFPGPYTGPASTPRQVPPRARRLSRPMVIVPVVAAVAIGVAGYLIGHEGAASAGHGLGSSPPASTGRTATAAAAGSNGSGTYPLKYSNAKFTMPGGGCQNGDIVTPASVTFTGTGPDVITGAAFQIPGTSAGDVDLDCELGNGNANPGIDFDGAKAVAQVTATPGPSACLHAITTSPEAGSIQFNTLSTGMQFCIDAASGLLVRITLISLNATSYNLTWSATAWSLPSTG